MLPHAEPNHLLLEMDAASMLIRWREFIKERIETSFTHDGKRCTIVLEIVSTIPMIEIPNDAPTPCERAIADAIRDAGRRLLQPELIATLTDHGESTVVKSLARMVRDGRLTHVTKRGYGIGCTLTAE